MSVYTLHDLRMGVQVPIKMAAVFIGAQPTLWHVTVATFYVHASTVRSTTVWILRP